MLGVDLQSSSGAHVALHAAVPQCLGLHDSLHVAAPSELASDQNTWGVDNTVGNDNLLDLVTKSLLHLSAESLEFLAGGLTLGLLLFGLLELESLLGDTDQLLTLKLLQLGDGVLVNGVDEQEDLEALLLQDFKEG